MLSWRLRLCWRWGYVSYGALQPQFSPYVLSRRWECPGGSQAHGGPLEVLTCVQEVVQGPLILQESLPHGTGGGAVPLNILESLAVTMRH